MNAHRSVRRVGERALRTVPAAAVALALCAAALTAQATPADEFVRLEPVVQQALAVAAPFTVTIETFGGTRQVERAEGPMDGEAPPKARPRPAPKPKPKPKPDDAPEKDKDGDKQPKKPLVTPATGFQQAQGRATGVVLTADGWILVARFALALEPTTILVTVPGVGTFPATRAGEDTSRGLALVKIEASGLPVPTFVDPGEVRVGQWALALGRTFAADLPTVHFGIVSAKGRQFGRALQIDAGTSPANYGGPVVDVQGRVLGIAVPLSPSGRNAGVEWYDSGVGFAATIADIAPLLARMQQGEALQRGWLGVQFDPKWLGPGAKVVTVDARGPAHAAGVQKGDVLLQVGGVPVRNAPHALACISGHLGGDALALAVRRADGTEAALGPIVLADAPWSEQQVKKDAETPASFSLPEPQQGR
ncbi:MAG: PDZ domain-containing protein [Planctomycetes bacterium]|nr:PDZ domain-containing protein [Planctomycetota bacterium]